MVMMAYLMAMTMTMTASMSALRQSRACEREAGRNDQRCSEGEFLHHVLHGVSALVRSMNDAPAGKFPVNVEES